MDERTTAWGKTPSVEASRRELDAGT